MKIRKSGDKASIKKAESIISELRNHPETGIGQPEKLRFGLTCFRSQQINKKDRLIYIIEDNIVAVTVVSAIGHYGDK